MFRVRHFAAAGLFLVLSVLAVSGMVVSTKRKTMGVCAGMTTMTEDGKLKKQGKSLQSRADVRLFTYLSALGQCMSFR